jgi:colanic acid/amylovoran biosynthesis glycosyltransferase
MAHQEATAALRTVSGTGRRHHLAGVATTGGLLAPNGPAPTGRPVRANAKLVYLVSQYPSITHTFIRREIQALEKLGFDVTRVSVRDGGPLIDPGDKEERQKTFRLLDGVPRLVGGFLWTVFRRPTRFFAAVSLAARQSFRSDRSPLHHFVYLIEACALARIISHSGATHLHAHFGTNPAEVAMLAAAIAGVSYSFTVHGYDEYDRPEFLGLGLKIRRAVFVACVSFYGRAQLLRWCDAADREKIHLVRCGLDLDAIASHSGGDSYPARFVCVARLCREKAQETLIAAAALLKARGRSFEVVIVGDGAMRGALERMIAQKGLEVQEGQKAWVRLTGWLSGPDVLLQMREARALVVPSFAENLPVVMMEAMALRRPVIATFIAGIPELVVPEQTGWLVPASSVEALADAMEACLVTSDADMARMGEVARARVQDMHDVASEAGKLAELFPR